MLWLTSDRGTTLHPRRTPWPFVRQKPFALSDIGEVWNGPGGNGPLLESCALLTTEPNDVGADVHDRMPVILDPADYDGQLDPENVDTVSLQSLLKPFPAESMTARPVSRFVNHARNEGEECVGPPS